MAVVCPAPSSELKPLTCTHHTLTAKAGRQTRLWYPDKSTAPRCFRELVGLRACGAERDCWLSNTNWSIESDAEIECVTWGGPPPLFVPLVGFWVAEFSIDFTKDNYQVMFGQPWSFFWEHLKITPWIRKYSIHERSFVFPEPVAQNDTSLFEYLAILSSENVEYLQRNRSSYQNNSKYNWSDNNLVRIQTVQERSVCHFLAASDAFNIKVRLWLKVKSVNTQLCFMKHTHFAF